MRFDLRQRPLRTLSRAGRSLGYAGTSRRMHYFEPHDRPGSSASHGPRRAPLARASLVLLQGSPRRQGSPCPVLLALLFSLSTRGRWPLDANYGWGVADASSAGHTPPGTARGRLLSWRLLHSGAVGNGSPTTALGERLGDLGADLRLHRPRRRVATRPLGTGVDRGWPLHLARLWHEPQPTTVSHDGGCADRPGARVSRCTPTGLHHAASAVNQRKPRPPTCRASGTAWPSTPQPKIE